MIRRHHSRHASYFRHMEVRRRSCLSAAVPAGGQLSFADLVGLGKVPGRPVAHRESPGQSGLSGQQHQAEASWGRPGSPPPPYPQLPLQSQSPSLLQQYEPILHPAILQPPGTEADAQRSKRARLEMDGLRLQLVSATPQPMLSHSPTLAFPQASPAGHHPSFSQLPPYTPSPSSTDALLATAIDAIVDLRCMNHNLIVLNEQLEQQCTMQSRILTELTNSRLSRPPGDRWF